MDKVKPRLSAPARTRKIPDLSNNVDTICPDSVGRSVREICDGGRRQVGQHPFFQALR